MLDLERLDYVIICIKAYIETQNAARSAQGLPCYSYDDYAQNVFCSFPDGKKAVYYAKANKSHSSQFAYWLFDCLQKANQYAKEFDKRAAEKSTDSCTGAKNATSSQSGFNAPFSEVN